MAAKGKIESAAARRNQALELRKAGASYRAIGEKLGVSHVMAFNYISQALGALAEVQAAAAADLRTIELLRLDDMQLALAKQVRAGSLGAIDRTLRIMERRSRYCGLDSPERQERSGEVTINIVYADE